MRPTESAVEIMKPYNGAIDVWDVDAAVGNVNNNRAGLMDRASLL